MVVRIRLAMHGLRNHKYFHLVVMNAKTRRDAVPIETLGLYKPRIKQSKGEEVKTCEWSVDRIKYWLGVGAVPTSSAAKLLALGGLLPRDSPHYPLQYPGQEPKTILRGELPTYLASQRSNIQ